MDSKRCTRTTKRQSRLIKELYRRDAEWIWREEVDRCAGASNGPQIILELRAKLDCHECIEMQRVEQFDRDGQICHPGRYRLTPAGRALARQILGVGNDE